MNMLTRASDRLRPEGYPRVIDSGPTSLRGADQLTRALGWLSIGLGVSELLAARSYTRALGIEGQETWIRACGVREIGAGVLSLSTERSAGLWSRVGGDALDLGLLGAAMRRSSKPGNVALALAVVAAITLVDLAGAQSQTKRRSPDFGSDRDERRDYSDRSGFPQGIERARGAASATRRPASPASQSPSLDA
jgi:hypothetical protein